MNDISKGVFSFCICCFVNVLFDINICECEAYDFHLVKMGFEEYEPIISIEKGECLLERDFWSV